jgi:hypothetical protein
VILRILTIVGSLVILVGLFMPMISGPPELEVQSFFTWGDFWDGVLVLILALTGLVIGIKNKCRWGLAIAPVTLLLTYLACDEFFKIQGAARSMSMMEVSLATGPWVLGIGSLIMLISACLAFVVPSGDTARDRGIG